MTSLRDKARDIKAAGVAERGNFQPTGAPLRAYNYWLEHSKSEKAVAIRRGFRKENFCHFWRVVAIWAPLRWLENKANSVFESKFFITFLIVAALVVFVWAVLTFSSFVGFAAVVIAGITAFVSGLLGGIGLAIGPDKRADNEFPSTQWVFLMALVGFPVAIVSFIITKIGTNKSVRRYVDKNQGKVIGIIFAAIIITFLTMIWITESLVMMLSVLGGVVGMLALLTGLVFLMVYISEFISGRRALAKERAEMRVRDNDFTIGKSGVVEDRPGFFTGLADFFILLGQIVRVKKWKICPLVEVKDEA
jgi:hypothetical protein